MDERAQAALDCMAAQADSPGSGGRLTAWARLLRGGRRAYRATAGNPRIVAVVAAAGIAAGTAAWLAGQRSLAGAVWSLVTAVALVPLTASVVRDLLHREPGVDLIALLAMSGALALGQSLAGAVVALMLSGGLTLEAYAAGRASRELSALLARAPRTVQCYRERRLEQVSVEDVRRGDILLVRPGEVVPVDGVTTGPAVLDESALTGESRPVEHGPGSLVRSGGVNASGPFDLRSVASAEESTYAGIVRLVREAQSSKAPFVRLADRYAVLFLPLTLAVSAGAWAVPPGPGAGAGRARGRHSLPADPGGPGGDRGRDLARGPARPDRQGRRRPRDAGQGPRGPARQDGHSDGGRAAGLGRRDLWALAARRAVAPRGVA